MNKQVLIIFIIAVVLAQDSYSQYQKKTANFSFIAKNLEWKGIAVQDGNYTIWGCAPIQGEDGKTHLFVARWPEKNVDPAFLAINGKYYLYFKARGKNGLRYGLATSTKLEGPYIISNDPVTDNNATLEDATAFYYKNTFYLLTTDNHGKNTGITGGGTLWKSKDGMTYKLIDAEVAYDRLPSYYPDYDPKKVTKIYGPDPKLERPKILMINNRPAYLYAPSGWNIFGGDRTVGHVLKINLD